MTKPDRISRAELALALKLAAQREVISASHDSISLAEAERIAQEVGVAPAELRAALRALYARRLSSQGILGPDGIQTVQDTVRGTITPATAHHMLARGQLELPIVGGAIDHPTEGLWRLTDGRGGAALQVISRGEETAIAGTQDRRVTKWGLLAGGTMVGASAGYMAGAFLAIGLFEATVFEQSIPLGLIAALPPLASLAGAVLGGVVGRAAWVRAARRTRERLFAALERMRAVAETEMERVPPPGPENDRSEAN